MNALAIGILCCVIQVTLFTLAAGLVYGIARRQGPRHGARIAASSLLGVAILTICVASPWPNWTRLAVDSPPEARATTKLTAELGASDPREVDGSRPLEPNEASGVSSGQEASATWPELFRAAWNSLQETSVASEATATGAIEWTWRHGMASMFAAAAVLGLLRLVSGAIGVARLKRRSALLRDSTVDATVEALRKSLACKPSIAVRQCAQLTTAATIGWKRPIILLPANWRDWQPAELQAALAHEIAHICRRDFATHAIAQLGVALHFYHPLVHWLAGRLRLEQEMAADAMAARVAGGQRLYLTSLARLALAQPAARLSWPVHAFLPTRHTFLRRIEMLRDRDIELSSGQESNVRRRTWGAVCAAALVAAGLGAAGLRAPTVANAQIAPAKTIDDESAVNPPTKDTRAATASTNGARYDFSYVPENLFGLFMAIRPAELAADPRLQPLAKLLEENTRPGVPSKLVEQTTLVLVAHQFDERGRTVHPGGEQIMIRTKEPVDFATYLNKGYPTLTEVQDEGHDLWVISPRPSTMSFFALDKQTLIGRVRTGLLKLLSDEDAKTPPKGAKLWQSEAKGPLLVVVNGAAVGSMLPRLDPRSTEMVLLTLAPLLQSVDTLVLSVDPDEQLTIRGRAFCKSTDDAARAAETLNALAVLAENSLDTFRQQLSQADVTLPPAKMKLAMLDLAESALKNRQFTIDGKEVRFKTTLGKTDATVRMIVDTFAPAIQEARDAAREAQHLNNVKQIALAMLNYEAANRHLPPAVLYGPDGKTPHSWRVAILPYLEQQALYNQYHFDEPWDSENNRNVLEQIPNVYRHPKDEAASTDTSYFVLTGPETLFSDKEGTPFQEITDGTSNTLLVVEAKRDLPWTKPEDISYAADAPLPELGGWFPNKILAALCDGSARSLDRKKIDDATLRAMITKAGGEPSASYENIAR